MKKLPTSIEKIITQELSLEGADIKVEGIKHEEERVTKETSTVNGNTKKELELNEIKGKITNAKLENISKGTLVKTEDGYTLKGIVGEIVEYNLDEDGELDESRNNDGVTLNGENFTFNPEEGVFKTQIIGGNNLEISYLQITFKDKRITLQNGKITEYNFDLNHAIQNKELEKRKDLYRNGILLALTGIAGYVGISNYNSDPKVSEPVKKEVRGVVDNASKVLSKVKANIPKTVTKYSFSSNTKKIEKGGSSIEAIKEILGNKYKILNFKGITTKFKNQYVDINKISIGDIFSFNPKSKLLRYTSKGKNTTINISEFIKRNK